MLGNKIMDPEGIECGIEEIAGMSLIELETIFEDEKITSQVKAQIGINEEHGILKGTSGMNITGYEIHCGKSLNETGVVNIVEKADHTSSYMEGSINQAGNVFGTYIHGIFDSLEFTRKILDNIRVSKGLEEIKTVLGSYEEFKEAEYQKLAEHVRKYTDIEKIYEIIEKGV